MQAKSFIKHSIFLAIVLMVSHAWAGPPFLTNNPEPVSYKNTQLILFEFSDKTPTYTNIQAPFLEVDYGLLPQLEVNMTLGIDSNISQPYHQNGMGFSDIELGMTYRFLQETEYLPQIGFLPAIFIPTGESYRGLGNGHTYYQLCLWGQKTLRTWTVSFGGGYVYNHAATAFNYWISGLLLQKNVNSALTLGAEIYYQGATYQGIPSTTIANVGGTYNFTTRTALLFSAGHSVKGMQDVVTYVGLQWCLDEGC